MSEDKGFIEGQSEEQGAASPGGDAANEDKSISYSLVHGVLKLETALLQIERSSSILETLEIQNHVEAFKVWVRTKEGGEKLAREANTIVLIAERKLGELIRAMPGKGPNQDVGKGRIVRQLGIKPSRARTARQLAKIPEKDFKEHVQAEGVTATGVLTHFGLREGYSYTPQNVAEWRGIALDAVRLLESVSSQTGVRSEIVTLRQRCQNAIRRES